jgi:NADH-quinone oxidoreductase subunit N
MNYLELLQLAAPEAIVTATALLVLTIGLLGGGRTSSATVSSASRGTAPTSATPGAGQGLSVLVAGLGLAIAAAVIMRLPAHASLFHGMLVISPLNSLFQIVVLLLAFFTILLARAERDLPHRGEYLAMILLATIGLMLLVGSEELLTIFIGLELTGLSLYILTAFDKRRPASAEAALKYFLFGSTASAFTLFGLSFIYGLTGTTSLDEIGARLATMPVQPILLAGVVMTLIGFAFKIAAAPFHLWAPDAYQGAPISSAAFIASGSKVASFVVLGKILLIAFVPLHGNAGWHAMAGGWVPILSTLAALSILIGNLAALVQKNVRRLLAYSAVAHAGYTLLGLIAGGRAGFSATLFYTTLYGLTLVGAFGVVGFVRRETGGEELSDFAGLRDRSPVLAGCLAVFVLSLAGLPPLAGFFGKFYLFSVALRSTENYGLLWLVVIALFGSLISLYYYLLILKAAFVDGSNTSDFAFRPDLLTRLAIVVLALAVLLLGIFPASLLNRILASF